jgi:capsular exopolysaccharide synthesis family protein
LADSFSDSREEPQAQSGFNLDFKRVLSRAIRFWYVIVLFLVASFAFAFYQNRYTHSVYSISASMLIREGQEKAGAELLYKSGLVSPYRNYLNEPYIIRSYPVIEKVIRDLNFHISFYQKGYIVTSEVYGNFPIKVESCTPYDIKTGKLIFTVVDEKQYTLELPAEDKQDQHQQTFAFGDSITYMDFNLCFRNIGGGRIKKLTGDAFDLIIQNPTAVAGSYIARLKVEWAELGSGVVKLSVIGTNAEKERDFLSTLIQTYSDQDLRKKNETAARTITFIQRQLKEIKDSLRTVEFDLERFGSKGRVKDMSLEAQKLLNKLEEIETQKATLSIKQNYYHYLDEYLSHGEDRIDQVILPSSLDIVDPILSGLLAKIVELQLEIKGLDNTEQANNPLATTKRKTLSNQVREIKNDIEESVTTLRSTDKIKYDFYNKQLSVVEKQLDALPASERQLISVQRNYSLLENLYVYLMQKLSEAKISEAANTSDIIQINPAMNGGSISPKPQQNYMIAAFVGLAIPFAIFVLFELLNNKVQSKEDIEKVSTIPFLGGLGHNVATTNLAVAEKPRSGLAESFRAMRSNLNYFTGNKTQQVFMVSSSISGEGKTFTTINLSTVFALSGKRTLIIGADMRRPKIYDDFKCHNNLGLSTFLSGISEFKDVIQKTEIDNLFLMSGGPIPPNPSELLLTDRFEKLIQLALLEFDYIIIDTPPLALVTDAFVISKYVNHTVFVLRQNYSPKDFVRSIDEYYRAGKLKNISLILNDIYKSGFGYGYGQDYSYHYGYSYGYGRKKKDDGNGYYEA